MLANLKRSVLARIPLTPTGFMVAGIVALLVAVAVFVVFATWQHERRAAAEAKVGAAMGEARGRSAADAGAVTDRAHDFATSSEALTRENADAIRQAPGADQRLSRELNAVGRRGVCLQPAYRSSSECMQLLGRAQPQERR